MGKKKAAIKFSIYLYVQRVIDGDSSYFLASENLEDVDLESGDVVGVYMLDGINRVVPGERTLEAVK